MMVYDTYNYSILNGVIDQLKIGVPHFTDMSHKKCRGRLVHTGTYAT